MAGFFLLAIYQPFTLLWHAETKREMYQVRAPFLLTSPPLSAGFILLMHCRR